MRSYHFHTASETKTVTSESDCEDTIIMHKGSSPGALQGLDLNRPHARYMAGKKHRGKKT